MKRILHRQILHAMLLYRDCILSYGWRNNLVYTFTGGVHWIFGRFWILYGSCGAPEGSHWISSTLEIQNPWFSARTVKYGFSSDPFSWFSTFSEKLSRLPGPVFVVFWDLSSENRIFEFSGLYQKEPRQKVTQNGGGITSGSALFDLFVAI